MTDSSTTTEFVPPYIAFRTLLALVQRMEHEEPPERIDKSYLDNLSGGYRTQVLAALHSLGLVHPDGYLSDRMKALVTASEEERKEQIGAIVRELYAPVLRLSANSTQQQMIEAFTETWPTVTGDTRRKSIAFFLNACQYAGIKVSRHWKTPRVAPSGRRGKAEKVTASQGTENEHPGDEVRPVPQPANTRELKLRSGGVVTLGLSVDLFSLTGDDRKFVFELIDKMSAYEDQRSLPAGPSATANGREPAPEPKT